MKLAVIVILSALCVLYTQASPIDEVPPSTFIQDDYPATEKTLIRVRRLTCDLLSVEAKGVKINHAACAAHCLARLKRGGYCTARGICHCR